MKVSFIETNQVYYVAIILPNTDCSFAYLKIRGKYTTEINKFTKHNVTQPLMIIKTFGSFSIKLIGVLE